MSGERRIACNGFGDGFILNIEKISQDTPSEEAMQNFCDAMAKTMESKTDEGWKQESKQKIHKKTKEYPKRMVFKEKEELWECLENTL
jgi:hypothetical protein